MELYNYKAIIEYDGTDFYGFQSQPGELRTIQGELLRVLNKIFNTEKIRVSYSGRTDAGVHAIGQVVNFKSNKLFKLHRLKWSLNSLLPEDVSVKSLDFAEDGFDARRSALWREYNYYIINDYYQNVFLKKYSLLLCRELDIKLMQEACKFFVGRHDFSAFCSPSDANKSKIREIMEMEITRTDNFHQENMIIFRIRANAFLYNMARIIVGIVTEVGSKSRKISDIELAFSDKDVNYSGSIVDAKGLFLTNVGYKVF